MSERDEWIKCVRDIHEDNKGKSWCGQQLYGQWAFMDIDHAALNGRNKGRLIVCPECLSAIVSALQEGQ